MIKKKNYLKYSEVLVVITIWLAVFTLPLLFFYVKDGYVLEKDIWINIRLILPFFMLFLINHFVLVPKLLFKHKKKAYFVSIISLVFLFTLGLKFSKIPPVRNTPPNHREQRHIPPPYERPPFEQRFPERDRPRPASQPPLPPFVFHATIAFLLMGFDTGLRMMVKWSDIQSEKDQLEKENVSNQLAFLKNQISPHFFMNTLNNIHALIDIDTEEAKEAVIKLSKLMRHILYEAEKDQMDIQKEIDFVESYIELMKLRFSERVEINFKIEGAIPDKKIPPLLFASLLENAFKHGVSYQYPSFIRILFKIEQDELTFYMENSDHSKQEKLEASGIGLVNTQKRLELLYDQDFLFDQIIEEGTYKTTLSIPL